MAVSLDTYLPFDAGAGSNVTEDTWRQMMKHMRLSDGVLRGFANEFSVFADSTGMQVKVRTGECFIRGHYGLSGAEKTLPVAAAHATLPRIDRAILRANFVLNLIEADILTGTAAASPVAPSLTHSSGFWEVKLAAISVPALDTSIDAAQVTDERETADGPGGRWIQSSAQSIGASSSTKVQFNGTAQRTHPDITVTGTNNTDFALQKLGRWEATTGARLGGGAGGERSLAIEFNGAQIAEANTSPAIGWAQTVTTDFFVASVGQSLNVRLFHDHSSSLSTTSSKTFLSLRWLGY